MDSGDRDDSDSPSGSDVDLTRRVHQAIKATTDVYHKTYAFNGSCLSSYYLHVVNTGTNQVVFVSVAVAELMKLSNALTEARNHPDLSTDCFDQGMRALTLMLAPLAPHTAAEMWERICKLHETADGAVSLTSDSKSAGDISDRNVHNQSWPEFQDSALVETQATIVIQVGGQRKGEITICYRRT